MPTFATRPLTTSFYNTRGVPAELHGRTAKTANIGIAIRQIPYSTIVLGVEEAMLWIKEVEMVDSLDELKSSRSVYEENVPNFELLVAKIASALNKIIKNSQF